MRYLFGAVVLISTIWFHVATYAVLLFAAVIAILQKPGRLVLLAHKWKMVFAFLFAVWSVTSIYFAQGFESWGLIAQYVGPPLVILVTLTVCRREKGWHLLGFCYLLGCAIACANLLWNVHNAITYENTGRYSAGNLNPNYLAYCLCTSIPVAFSFLARSRFRTPQVAVYSTGLLVTAGCVVLTGSRGGFLALILTVPLTFFLVIYSKLSRKWVLLIAGIAVALGISFFTVLHEYLPLRLQQLFDIEYLLTQDVSNSRLVLWSEAFTRFLSHPVFGVGGGMINREYGLRAHNSFIGVATEYGVIGLFFYLGAVIAVFGENLRARRHMMENSAGLLLFLVWLVISLTGVWDVALPAWFAGVWLFSAPRVGGAGTRTTRRGWPLPVQPR